MTIAYVDNYAFGGEASPIVIVTMLLMATTTAGVIWRQRGWIAAAATLVCVPLAHVIKHIFGLPDTLHPNTYTSILLLATFSLVVATAGIRCGVLFHRLRTGILRSNSKPA